MDHSTNGLTRRTLMRATAFGLAATLPRWTTRDRRAPGRGAVADPRSGAGEAQAGQSRVPRRRGGRSPGRSARRRLEIAPAQHPFAIVVTCSDSRVPPEALFAQGLGDLFVIRNAGNTIDTAAMGSLEYAALELERSAGGGDGARTMRRGRGGRRRGGARRELPGQHRPHGRADRPRRARRAPRRAPAICSTRRFGRMSAVRFAACASSEPTLAERLREGKTADRRRALRSRRRPCRFLRRRSDCAPRRGGSGSTRPRGPCGGPWPRSASRASRRGGRGSPARFPRAIRSRGAGS